MAVEEVVAGEAVVVEEVVVGEEEGEGVEVGEEVDGAKEDMEAMEDMVDTEEREDGTSINFYWYFLVWGFYLKWSTCCVSHELSSVVCVFCGGRKHFYLMAVKNLPHLMIDYAHIFYLYLFFILLF